ncbi:MAG: hypothetical protein ACXWYN_02935 [Actinomycetota bacterium]
MIAIALVMAVPGLAGVLSAALADEHTRATDPAEEAPAAAPASPA